MDVTPLVKPKRRPKSKREPNPQKAQWSRTVDPAAVEAARRPYCVRCGRRNLNDDKEYFHVHHIRGRTKSDGHDMPENLIHLCLECHERAHGKVVNGKGPITADELKYFTLEDISQQ